MSHFVVVKDKKVPPLPQSKRIRAKGAGNDDVMAEIAKSDIPTVLVNITDRQLVARAKAVSTICLDNADAGRCAAKHLLEQGSYKSAGFVHDVGTPFYSKERMATFREVMKKNKLATSEFPEGGDLRESAGGAADFLGTFYGAWQGVPTERSKERTGTHPVKPL